MNQRRILIWGAGGHGQVVADVAEASGWEVVGFVAREAGAPMARAGRLIPIIEGSATRAALSAEGSLPLGAEVIGLGVGSNSDRLAIATLLDDRVLPPLIHPSAVISPSAQIGAGTVALPNVVVNARASVGRAVILNTAVVVEHDCRVGEGVHLSPGAVLAGEVVVERLAWVGTGAVVIPRLTIGEGAIVGAGSTAHRDVPPGATVVGNPARLVPGK